MTPKDVLSSKTQIMIQDVVVVYMHIYIEREREKERERCVYMCWVVSFGLFSERFICSSRRESAKIQFPRLSTLVESLGNHFFEESEDLCINTPCVTNPI
jgi:hypothetical protein